MRKNVKKQLALRVLSTAALMAMVSSIATAAFADTYDLNTGSVTVETKANGITYVTQTDNSQVDGYARNENSEVLHEHPDTTGVTITSGGTPTSNTITVNTAENQTTNVTLENVHIEQPDSHWSECTDPAPIEIKGKGDTNLELNGNNIVLSGNSKHAGIEKADVNGTGTLTIKDDVNDNGKPKTGTEADTTGKLLAGGYQEGAAIGGGDSGGNSITIKDHAVVDAYGKYGAAIGDGGLNIGNGRPTTITISGNATVHA